MPAKVFTAIFGLLFILALGACRSAPPDTASPTPLAAATPTRVPLTPTPTVATCADLDANWGQNWPAVVETLEQLLATDQSCGAEPLLSKKYAALFSYAASLEENGQLEAAISQYQAALALDPQRQEALNALVRLQALPKPTPPACLSTVPPRPDPARAATPDRTQFITVGDGQLQLNGQPFKVRGVNYYPRQAPWQRFLAEADPAQMAAELDLIKEAGFNTLRIFLWYEPLFTCQPEDAIPNETAFAKVDALLELAAERDLKVIVTLNDLPDLTFRPLYTDYAHYDNQTSYIVRRYRHDPNILAWDVRNEGDLDYGAESKDDARFTQAEVMDWVGHVSQLIRDNDPHHLVTAGWWGDPTPTSPYVDFLSFHHWTESDQLQRRLNAYRRVAAKPLLLGEIGYDTLAASAKEQRDKEQQVGAALGRALRVVEAQKLAGWVVWTAFDFVPAAGQPENREHFFGLWRTDLSPKPALKALPLP